MFGLSNIYYVFLIYFFHRTWIDPHERHNIKALSGVTEATSQVGVPLPILGQEMIFAPDTVHFMLIESKSDVWTLFISVYKLHTFYRRMFRSGVGDAGWRASAGLRYNARYTESETYMALLSDVQTCQMCILYDLHVN